MNEKRVKVSVDFRFADAEDTAEILALVNEAFLVEQGSSGLAFTTRNRLKAEEIDACLLEGRGDKRWLVLETPHPEERMVAAALIHTECAPGTGSVEVLAVEPSRQSMGLGSHLLRRAEGVLLSLRCRFVRLRVPQWRHDVLAWAAKQGYKETGGGLWGEMGGEDAMELTRPTRYFDVTRDLLADKAVSGTFGEGTARFVAATSAIAAEKRLAASSAASAPTAAASGDATGVKTERLLGQQRETAELMKEDDSRGLAAFLSTVLKGLSDVDEQQEEEEEEEGDVEEEQGEDGAQDGTVVVEGDTAPVTVGARVDSSSSAEAPPPPRRASPPPATRPPSPPAHDTSGNSTNKGNSSASDDVSASSSGVACSSDLPGAATPSSSNGLDDGRAPVAILSERARCVAVRCKSERSEKTAAAEGGVSGTGDAGGVGEASEVSVEDLLGSLMRALRTDQGRADFGRLAAGGGDCQLPREEG